jgi:surface antigen
MKKTILSAITISLVTMGLYGCAPGQNTAGSTAVGAATGGLIASTLFHGRGDVTGILAGTLLGGSLGYMVGRQMDQQDQANMSSAIVNTPVGEQANWTNQDTNVTYVVQPVRNYQMEGRYCREYRTRINVGGQWRAAYGHACRMPDGQWKITQ